MPTNPGLGVKRGRVIKEGFSASVLDIWNEIFMSKKKFSRAWEKISKSKKETCTDDSESLHFWLSHSDFESRISSNVGFWVSLASCSCLSDSWPSDREFWV